MIIGLFFDSLKISGKFAPVFGVDYAPLNQCNKLNYN